MELGKFVISFFFLNFFKSIVLDHLHVEFVVELFLNEAIVCHIRILILV